MEKDQEPMNREYLYGNLFERILTVFALFGVTSALLSFYVLLPSTIGSTNEISSLNPYSYFLLNLTSSASSIYLLLGISAAAITGSVITLFIGRDGISAGVSKSNRMPFFKYLSIFILIELVLSLISPQVSSSYANDPVLKMSLGAQNFVFIASSLSQSIILQFVPLSVIIVVYLAMKRDLSLKSFLNPYEHVKSAELAIIVISAALASFLTYVDPGSVALNFVSFFVMNFIYVRFGLMRSIVSGFTISQFNIILEATQVPIIPYLMYVFLIVWSIFGIYSFVTLFTKRSRERSPESVEIPKRKEEILEEEIEHPPEETPLLGRNYMKPSNFWIRSPCPSCGNYSFSIKDDMSLECKSCHQLIDKDAVAEFNVRLVRSRV